MMFFCSCGKKLASRKGLTVHILESLVTERRKRVIHEILTSNYERSIIQKGMDVYCWEDLKEMTISKNHYYKLGTDSL